VKRLNSVTVLASAFEVFQLRLKQTSWITASPRPEPTALPWDTPAAVCLALLFNAVSSTVSKPSSAIDIHADPEVMMQNGTTGTLRCTFKSSEVVSSSTSVTWSFQSSQPDNQFFKAPYTVSPEPGESRAR